MASNGQSKDLSDGGTTSVMANHEEAQDETDHAISTSRHSENNMGQDEVARRIQRGLEIVQCSGRPSNSNVSTNDYSDAAAAMASLANTNDGMSIFRNVSSNSGPASMNQQDGRSLGISGNPTPPAPEYEINRLTTYRNWPPTAPVTPQALARAGFFYTGKDDIVECFSCQGQIRDFEFGDTAMGEHKKHFPRCPFVRGAKNHGNVPMGAIPNFSEMSSSDPSGATGTSSENKAKEKEASLFSAKDADKLEAAAKDKENKPKAGNGNNKGNKGAKQGTQKPKPEEDAATKADNQAKSTFKSEFKRLLSYQNWPESCPADPRDCAKAGFFFTGKEDVVQCFACFGKIGNFKAGDVPMVEHNRHFPSCPYIMGLNVGNQPITSIQMASALQAIQYKEQSSFGNSAQKEQQKQKGQLTQTAKPTADWGGQNQRPNQKRVYAKVRHPQFSSEQARLESYERWPPAVGIAPIQLARAGFFYTGTNDSCKCFYCDGGLKNWEPKDEPWMEHARWFPRCEWLVQQRGQAYVDYVVHNFPPPRVSAEVLSAGGYRKKYGTGGAGGEDTGEDEAGTFQTAQTAVLGSGAEGSEGEPEAGVAAARRAPSRASGILDEMMKSKVAKTVLDMGYDRRLVRAVIRRKLDTSQSTFTNAQDLLEAIFDAEGNIELEDEDEPLAGGGEEKVSQLAKDLQNVTLVERSPGQGDASSKASEGPGELSSHASAGKLSGSQRSSSAPKDSPQTAPPAVGETSSLSYEDERPLPNTVLELKHELDRYRDSQLCKICMDKEMSTVFLPCNHMVACDECSQALSTCPICRKKIRNVVKIYKA